MTRRFRKVAKDKKTGVQKVKEDKGDMDKDGKDEPDSEEYLDNKDKAIKKAMKKEGTIKLKDIVNGIVGMKSVGTSIKRN